MDLYSAAKRMTRPFRFSNPWSHREISLASRGLIGDGITIDELARPFGTIAYEVLTSLGRRYRRVYKGG